MAYNIADLFEHTVDAVPDRPALIAGGTTLTFAELDARLTRPSVAPFFGVQIGLMWWNGHISAEEATHVEPTPPPPLERASGGEQGGTSEAGARQD